MALRFKRFWQIAGFGFIMLVAFLSLTPDPPNLGVPWGLKMGHVLAYAWLMLWFAQIYQPVPTRIRLGMIFCLLGVGFEYLQGLTDYRSFSYFDMVLNSIGVTIGYLLARTPLQHGLCVVERMLQGRALPNGEIRNARWRADDN
jgi:VanZ family protein